MTENQTANIFRATAFLYDLDDRDVVRDDIPFYLEQAARAGGDILELACGTGRVTLPLARAGHKIRGLDLSREMLSEFEKKLNAEPSQVREKVNLVHGDMGDFNMNQQFSLIFLPFRSFQALTLYQQQKTCLDSVHRHLTDKGRFIINVFRPYAFLDESWVAEEAPDFEKIDPRTGFKVRRTEIRRAIDVDRQIIYADLIYYVSQPDGSEKRLVEPLSLKYYYEDQMRGLLLARGFKIFSEMGYYDGRPITGGPELIFICGKDGAS